MSDLPPDSQEKTDHFVDIKASIIDIEKRFLKLASFQIVLSVAAVFTGVIALYAALTESYAVRKQTAASVWPYVQLIVKDTSNAESAYVKLSLNNVGVGPAKMQSMMVKYQGQHIRDWQTLIAKLDDKARLGITYGKSNVRERVLAPEESLMIFQTEEYGLALKLQQALFQRELELSYCYCSIFDDCWVKPLPDANGEQLMQSVEQCPDHGDHGFLN